MRRIETLVTASARVIMIVEDDMHVRSLLVRAVSRWYPDMHVIDLESAEDAWVQLQTLVPSILITDYLLPGISGLDLARRMRSSCPQTAIVLISALSLDTQALLQVDHFLSKPLTMPDLRRVLNGLLAPLTP